MLAFWEENAKYRERGGGEKQVNGKRSTERRHPVEKARGNNRKKEGRREGGKEEATDGPCVHACGLMRVQIVNKQRWKSKKARHLRRSKARSQKRVM